MKPKDLYARDDYELNYDMDLLTPCSGDQTHVPELGDDVIYGFNEQNDVSFRVYKEFWFDHRRFWRLASVWIGETPVMIIQNAGREGTDFHARYVTDADAYNQLITLARKHIKHSGASDDLNADLVSPDDDVKGLTAFYGGELGGNFSRHNY